MQKLKHIIPVSRHFMVIFQQKMNAKHTVKVMDTMEHMNIYPVIIVNVTNYVPLQHHLTQRQLLKIIMKIIPIYKIIYNTEN